VRVIIAGTRFNESDPALVAARYADVEAAMADYLMSHEITTVLSGAARGVDRLGERWAVEHGVPITRFPADWAKHGKAAGMIRNREMADNAEALVALWDGQSRGTLSMIGIARRMGLFVVVKVWT
jgi:hypothetical protein